MLVTQATLRFIAGPHSGQVMPLPRNREISIGRDRTCDIQLREDLISREHARIVVGSTLVIMDCGSRNGIAVNGERVMQAELQPGDRIAFGTSVAEVDLVARRRTTSNHARVALSMAGQLEAFALPDVLQLLAAGGKDGTVELFANPLEGAIDIRRGQIVRCSLAHLRGCPMKALTRLLRWTHGSFEVSPLHESAPDVPLHGSTQSALMEAMRQIDEVERLVATLGGLRSIVRCGANPARGEDPIRRELLRLLDERNCTVAVCLDAISATDLDTAVALIDLERSGAVCIERGGTPTNETSQLV